MSTRTARALLLAAVAASLACSAKDDSPAEVPASGMARGGTAADPTAVEISNYELTMDGMRRYAGAIKGFSAMSEEDSSILAAMSSGSANESTAQMIARIESSPVAMRVLRETGLTAEDYVLITAAYIQAAMTQGLLEASPEAKVPEGQSSRNVEFLRANRAEIERIMRDAGMTQ
ncbi:MAG: hypothetical protein ACR2GK_00625 [Gemmatimonadaceae bacterium]